MSLERQRELDAALQRAAPRLFAMLSEQLDAGHLRSELCASIEDGGGNALRLGIQAITDLKYNFPIVGIDRIEAAARDLIAQGRLPVVYTWRDGLTMAWLRARIVSKGGDA
jgi:hypothetical protein